MNKYSKKLTHKHRARSISKRDFGKIYGTTREGYFRQHNPWAFFWKLVRDDPRKKPQCKFGNRLGYGRMYITNYDEIFKEDAES